MPNTKQAVKALKQSKKRMLQNLKIEKDLHTLLKKTRQAIDAKDAKVGDMIKKAQKSLDKAVQKNIFKRNTASRTLSRLMKYYKQGGKIVKAKIAKVAK